MNKRSICNSLLAVLCICGMLLIAAAAAGMLHNGKSEENTDVFKETSSEQSEKFTEQHTEDTTTVESTVANNIQSWNLLLVNPWNELPDDFTVELKKLNNGHAIDKRAYPDLQAMMDAARAEGLSPLICSSYRTTEMQETLYENKVSRLRNEGYSQENAEIEAGRWVAVPGTSEHQAGLALDIVASSYPVLDEKQENTTEQKWLMENSYKYGFILRYPREKSEITGICYEPWHYRYVGREAAQEIYEQGICLEEYLDEQEDG